MLGLHKTKGQMAWWPVTDRRVILPFSFLLRYEVWCVQRYNVYGLKKSFNRNQLVESSQHEWPSFWRINSDVTAFLQSPWGLLAIQAESHLTENVKLAHKNRSRHVQTLEINQLGENSTYIGYTHVDATLWIKLILRVLTIKIKVTNFWKYIRRIYAIF